MTDRNERTNSVTTQNHQHHSGRIQHSRRSFLGTGLGLPLAVQRTMQPLRGDVDAFPGLPCSQTQSEYESIITRMRYMEYLGRPTNWDVVRNGFLPISPERVVILEPEHQPWHKTAGDRWLCAPAERDRLLKRIADHGDTNCCGEQLGLILRITKELASYYSAFEHWEEWAYRLVLQEDFFPSGVGCHLAAPYQFHVVGHVRTVNRPLDWWMILFPQGIGCWDTKMAPRQRIHAIITLMTSRPWTRDAGVATGAMCLLSCGLRVFADTPSPISFVEISQMDRVSAARLLNYHVVSTIPRYEGWLENTDGR